MAKPTIDNSRWGETSGGTPRAGLVNPTSGKKDVGHVDDEQPDADEFTYIVNQHFQWLKFLDGIFDASGNLILPTGLYVQVQGTGQFKHGTREQPVHPSAFQVGASGAAVFHEDYWTVAGGVCSLLAPLHLPVGKRIISLSYDYNWEGGSGQIDFYLVKLTLGGPSSSLDDATVNGSGSTWTTVPSNSGAINHVIATGEQLAVRVLSSNTSARIGGFRVYYDEP